MRTYFRFGSHRINLMRPETAHNPMRQIVQLYAANCAEMVSTLYKQSFHFIEKLRHN
jgi:hypothetical protein